LISPTRDDFMLDHPQLRRPPWTVTVGIIATLATTLLVGDDLLAGKLNHAVITLGVILAWAAFFYQNDRRPSEQDGQGLLDRLDRIAVALERSPASPNAPTPRQDLMDVAAAIDEKQWELANALLDEHRDHPDSARLINQLARARGAASDDLQGELKAAQEVGDPVRVLEIRDQLVLVLTDEPRKEIDSQLAKWFMALIMRRLRTGSVQPEVTELVAQVADRFAWTTEGASLRASLPTLRRSAGLCARCARPYRGISDACPICMAPPPPPPILAVEDEPEDIPTPEEFPFIDPLDPL
jgi:hypothetical protein